MIINRPLNDRREYRSIELKNGMKCLLVHDKTADKASAALDVNIGSYQDPDDLPGLAHFLEHLLFLGTKKFPSENEYSEYLARNGGHSNAYTSSVDTNYYFEVNWQHFNGALDRFAQFFLHPLFSKDAVQRELNAVDSEWKKNLNNDYRRVYAIQQLFASPRHPMHRFSSGNLESLQLRPCERGIDAVAELLKFYDCLYSANLMRLVVLSRDSLDELERMVSELFSGVSNKNLSVPEYHGHPYTPDHTLGRLLVVKPLKDTRQLSLQFAIDDMHPFWQSKPESYLSHLIGHESEGSVLAHLKQLGLATDLSCGSGSAPRGFDIFSVSITLSELGLRKWQSVASAVFEYINMLHSLPELPEWIYWESSKIMNVSFAYKEQSGASSFCSHAASQMQQYPVENVLDAHYVMQEFRPDLIKNVLSKLTVDYCLITLVAQQVDDPAFHDLKTEYWFQGQYGVRMLSEQEKQMFSPSGGNTKLHLPARNPFVLENPPQKLPELQEYEETPDKPVPPLMLVDTEMARLWHKKDRVFLMPKSNVCVKFTSPFASLTPYHMVMLKLYLDLVNDQLSEYSYFAQVADLHYDLETILQGISLSFSGFSEKLFLLAEKVLLALRNLNAPDPHRIQMCRDKYRKTLLNWAKKEAYQLAMFSNSHCLAEKSYTAKEKLKALDEAGDISFQQLQKFVEELFRHLHVEVLVHGDTDEATSKKFLANVLDVFKTSQAIPKSSFPANRSHLLPSGVQYACVFPLESKTNPNSAIEYYLQCGDGSDAHERTMCTLLKEILHEAAFDQLRTKEQLGYVVWGLTRRTFGSVGIRIVVMGDYDSIYLENRIEAFLQTFRDLKLKNMTAEEFEKSKEGLRGAYLQKPENLSRETNNWWNLISDGSYDFYQVKESITALENISFEELVAFYDKFIMPGAKERCKLSSHFRSQKLPSKLREYSALTPHAADEYDMFAISVLKELSEIHGIEMERDELFSLLDSLLTPAETIEVSHLAIKIAEHINRISKQEFSHESVTEEIPKALPFVGRNGKYTLAKKTKILKTDLAVLNEKQNWLLSPAVVPAKPLIVAYCRL